MSTPVCPIKAFIYPDLKSHCGLIPLPVNTGAAIIHVKCCWLLSPPILAQYGSTARCQSTTQGKQTRQQLLTVQEKSNREADKKNAKRVVSSPPTFTVSRLVTTCNKSLSPMNYEF